MLQRSTNARVGAMHAMWLTSLHSPDVGGFEAYCTDMASSGTWGDHVTLQAAADAFGVKISLLTSFEASCFVEIKPQTKLQSERNLYLSFWAEVQFCITPFARVGSVWHQMFEN